MRVHLGPRLQCLHGMTTEERTASDQRSDLLQSAFVYAIFISIYRYAYGG
jgi:hypothetical protein